MNMTDDITLKSRIRTVDKIKTNLGKYRMPIIANILEDKTYIMH